MLFSVISNQWGSGEVGNWGSGEVGKWGSGEVGKWGIQLKPENPNTLKPHLLPPASCLLTPDSCLLTPD